MTASFICLTPNPALDRIVRLGGPLTPGALHRVARLHESAGGKGVNVARVLRTLGADVTVAGFLGGFSGQKFRALLSDEGLNGVFVDVPGETRECQILLEQQDGSGHPTEINEAGPVVSGDDWQQLLQRLPSGQVIVSGSLPPGIDAAGFAELLTQLQKAAGRPVVDVSGPALAAAITAGVLLVKPNERELQSLGGSSMDPAAAARAIFARSGVPVLLTLGERGAAYLGEEEWLVSAPPVTAVNPVASGDCLLAAFLWARSSGWEIPEALRLGVAAGAENARSGGGARISREGIFALLEQVPAGASLQGCAIS